MSDHSYIDEHGLKRCTKLPQSEKPPSLTAIMFEGNVLVISAPGISYEWAGGRVPLFLNINAGGRDAG